MSIKIMADVWKRGPEDQASLLVLLAMADIANDDGELWPSVATIADKARMSERNARRIIRQLEVDGWLSTEVSRGRNNTSRYTIKQDKLSAFTGGKQDKITGQNNRTNCPPGQNEPENRTKSTVKPDIAVSAEPSRTIIKPSKTRDALDSQLIAILKSGLREETAKAFIEHRKAKKAKLTLHAAELIAAKLTGHPDPDAVVNNSIMNGWTGVFPDSKIAAPAAAAPDRQAKLDKWRKVANG
jgi:hypothetical protein